MPRLAGAPKVFGHSDGLGGLPSRMLSIGKLVAGQARYYLDQAKARVDVVDSIGDGIEEYYLGPTEARGEWIGGACRQLGPMDLLRRPRSAAYSPRWILKAARRCATPRAEFESQAST